VQVGAVIQVSRPLGGGHPCNTPQHEICLKRKSHFCVKPPPSVAVLIRWGYRGRLFFFFDKKKSLLLRALLKKTKIRYTRPHGINARVY